MAHEMTPADAAIILSGILLVVSLFVLSSADDDDCPTCFIRARAVQQIFSGLGETFWMIWLLVCLTVFIGGLILKLTHHEFAWKNHASSPPAHHQRFRKY